MASSDTMRHAALMAAGLASEIAFDFYGDPVTMIDAVTDYAEYAEALLAAAHEVATVETMSADSELFIGFGRWFGMMVTDDENRDGVLPQYVDCFSILRFMAVDLFDKADHLAVTEVVRAVPETEPEY